MKDLKWVVLLVLWVGVVVGCQEQTKPEVAVDTFPKEKVFTVNGTGEDFATAKSDAFVQLVKRAVSEMVPESYTKNPKNVDISILASYKTARHYVIGEIKKAPKDKSVRIKTGSDGNGNVVLTVTGWVNMIQLRDELRQMGYEE